MASIRRSKWRSGSKITPPRHRGIWRRRRRRPRARIGRSSAAWQSTYRSQAGLGRFFAAKFRAGVLYRIFQQTGDGAALEKALTSYRKARAAWAELADRAKGVYMADITVGEHPQLHGHWLDRLPAIDKDIDLMAKQRDQVKSVSEDSRVQAAIQDALGRPHRVTIACRHTAPWRISPRTSARHRDLDGQNTLSVRLYYRHVDQAERFETREMELRDNRWRATIPSAYTDSQYPLQYYFEVREKPGSATLYPGFGEELNNLPYYLVRRG